MATAALFFILASIAEGASILRSRVRLRQPENISELPKAERDARQLGLLSDATRSEEERSELAESLNVCDQGKLLPELYLIGAQKAGTSTFSSDLESLGVLSAGAWKEYHYFDKFGGISMTEHSPEAVADQHQDWLSKLKLCPTNWSGTGVNRRVVADYTPSNLRSVPLPAGTTPTGTHWGLWFLSNSAADVDDENQMNVPRTLAEFYPGQLRKQVTFVVMLREGLARMQSAWYSSSATDAIDTTMWQQCADCKADSFPEALEHTLDKAERTPPVIDDWLWASMYARHIHVWLKYFESQQFFFIPYQEYVVKQGKRRICKTLIRQLKVNLDCDKLKEGAHRNAHEHPDLEDDLPYTSLRRFHKVIEPENARLVEILVTLQDNGATLSGLFTDAPLRGTPTDLIRTWLKSGW